MRFHEIRSHRALPPLHRSVFLSWVEPSRARSDRPEASMADRAPRSPPVFRTSSSHSGADFEAGRVGRARGEEAPLGADPPAPLGRPGDASSPVRGHLHALGGAARLGSRQDHQPDHRRNASPLQEFQLSLHVDGRMDQQHAEARRVPRRADSDLWLMWVILTKTSEADMEE